MDATVVVVNYEGRGHLRRCLESLAAQEGAVFEVVVVDNASRDGSWDEAEGRARVQVVRNAENRGFGPAANQGAALARGRHLVFLNPDSTVEPGFLAALVSAADADPALGALQAVVLREDGEVNTAGNLQHYLGFSWAPGGGPPPPVSAPVREVAAASGAALLVPRERFLDVGGFWEPLFLYCEDTDLSWRLRQRGWHAAVCPAARSVHAYEFARNTGKLGLLERNRLLLLAVNYERRTLLALAPAIVATEVALVLAAARDGWLREKLGALRGAAGLLPAALRQRRRVQAARVVPDRELARRFDTRLGPEFGEALAALTAPVLAAYARFAGLPAGSAAPPGPARGRAH